MSCKCDLLGPHFFTFCTYPLGKSKGYVRFRAFLYIPLPSSMKVRTVAASVFDKEEFLENR